MIVFSDHGSFPSGHTANAATVATIAVILFPRVWVAVVGGAWVFAMAFSRTQVHAHWLSDTVGGTLVGVGATSWSRRSARACSSVRTSGCAR
jgi:undecaprenyl-diphosphatase